MHCDHNFVGKTYTESLRHAMLDCLYNNECDKVFDEGCDDKPPFKLCVKNKTKVSAVQKSCVYQKMDSGYEGRINIYIP